jgi:hypothetical protein
MDSKQLVEISKRYLRTETSALSQKQLLELATAVQSGQEPKAIEAPPGAEHMLTLDILNTIIAFFGLCIAIAQYLRDKPEPDTGKKREEKLRELSAQHPEAKVPPEQLQSLADEFDDEGHE